MSEQKHTHQYEEFSIPQIFTIRNSRNILKSEVVMGSGSFPYVTAAEGNNSIMGYVDYDRKMLEEGNCIFIGGKTTVFSYQATPFFSNDSHNLLLYCKAQEGRNEICSLYMIAQLKKALCKYVWSNSISYRKIQKEHIMLPIQTNEEGSPIIDPEHKYHAEGYIPDWDYMQERIAELEQERIAELEQFLIASDLNDYELNDIDKKVLIKRVETIPFCIHKLFCKKTIKGYPKSKENLQENQNGYFVYGQNIKRQHPHKILLDDIYLHKIDPNHPILAYTSSVGEIGMIDESFYRSGANGAFQGLLPRYKSYTVDETLYILASLGKQFKGFDYSTSMKNINDLEFSLPIQTNEEGSPIIDPERKYHAEGYIPDWDYMTSYIRAMKKVVIADVVKYKDEVIAKTRSLISTK